jgi:hypothetical protein
LGEDEIGSGLRRSSRRVGRLYPVLLDKHGNVIDGKHRLAADENWPKMRVDHVESEEDRLIARLICNVCRRNVSAEEKREILQELGELHVKAGVKPGAELASKISEETCMSYRWVMKYLPENFKERPGVGGASPIFNLTNVKEKLYKRKVACFATAEFKQLLSGPKERILRLKNYNNTDFVNLVIERRFYTRLEENAEKLGIEPEAIICNIFSLTLRKLEQMVAQRETIEASKECTQSH